MPHILALFVTSKNADTQKQNSSAHGCVFRPFKQSKPTRLTVQRFNRSIPYIKKLEKTSMEAKVLLWTQPWSCSACQCPLALPAYSTWPGNSHWNHIIIIITVVKTTMLNLSPVIMNDHAKGHLLTPGDQFFQGQPRLLTAALITVWIENFLIYFSSSV